MELKIETEWQSVYFMHTALKLLPAHTCWSGIATPSSPALVRRLERSSSLNVLGRRFAFCDTGTGQHGQAAVGMHGGGLLALCDLHCGSRACTRAVACSCLCALTADVVRRNVQPISLDVHHTCVRQRLTRSEMSGE